MRIVQGYISMQLPYPSSLLRSVRGLTPGGKYVCVVGGHHEIGHSKAVPLSRTNQNGGQAFEFTRTLQTLCQAKCVRWGAALLLNSLSLNSSGANTALCRQKVPYNPAKRFAAS